MQSERSFTRTISQSQSDKPRYQWLQFLLLIGFGLCVLLSVLALVALWWLVDTTSVTRQNDRLILHSENVLPQLALMALAGDPVDALAQQAFQAAEYDTSYALLTFGITEMPVSRIAFVLQLAQHFQDHQTDQATQLLRNARAIAILDPALSPLEAANALQQCTIGFLALDRGDEAIDAATQVKRIVEQTPDLLPAERNRLLQDLLPITAQLPNETLHQQVQELARSPYLSPDGLLIQTELPFSDGSFEYDTQLTDLIRERQQLSRRLAEQILQAPDANHDSLIQALRQTLQAEDQQRTLYFNQISSSANLTFPLQFWSLNEQRRWLITKVAIARRTFGLALMPEWEDTSSILLQELTQVTDNLQTVLLAMAQSQPEQLDQFRQRIAVLRWLALQAELGVYPRRAADIGERLRIAQNELSLIGTNAALPVQYQVDAVPSGFRIESD